MDRDARVQLSKTLSWVLRHEPEAIGLQLDEAGWVGLEALAEALRTAGRVANSDLSVIEARIREVVDTSDKGRFEVVDGRIRARQGHSVTVDLGHPSTRPPERLFHGTARRFLGRILQAGLDRQGRHHVHLSSDAATAREVGRRHGTPVVLVVEAARLHAEEGLAFYVTDNGVWLVDRVPAEYLATHED